MSTDDNLNLPRSGYEIIAKILHAYALCEDKPASLSDVASKAALDKTVVSRNNGFLNSLGLLSGGNSKSLTEEGKKLALALGNDIEEDAAQSWRRILLSNSSAKSVLDMLRVQKQIPTEQFLGKVASALGLVTGKSGVTVGINTLTEILLRAGFLKEEDGKYCIVSDVFELSLESPITDTEEISKKILSQTPSQDRSTLHTDQIIHSSGSKFQIPIHVNIELHLPASSEKAVYDALFKSIRENLMD